MARWGGVRLTSRGVCVKWDPREGHGPELPEMVKLTVKVKSGGYCMRLKGSEPVWLCVCFSLLLQLWLEGLRRGIPDNNP